MIYVTQVPANFDATSGRWAPRIDLAPLAEWGEHRVLIPPGVNFVSAEPLVGMMREGLASFEPERDYFLPLGDPTVMAVGMGVMGQMVRRFRMLKWDRYERVYVPMWIDLRKERD
jgi:hypothetical protein